MDLRHLILFIALIYIPLANGMEELAWDECVKEAAENNPAILAAKSAVRANEYLVRQSYSGFFPQLTTSLTYNYGSSGASSSGIPGTTLGPSSGGSFSPQLQLKQNLFAGQATISAVQVAIANSEAVEADLQLAKVTLSSELKIAFSNLASAQESIRLNESIKNRRETSYKLLSLLFESGRENYGNTLLAKANLSQANLNLAQAKDALRLNSVQLSKALGRSPSEALRVRGTPPIASPPKNPDFEELASKTPAFLKAVAQEKAAVAAKNTARAAFFPSLDLTSSVGQTVTSNSSNMTWLAGISLSFPFFNGGNKYYSWKNTSQAIVTAMLNKRSIQKNDGTAISNSYFAYVQALRQLEVDREFIEALTAQVKIAKENYNNGRLTFQNWDLFETSLIQRQQALLQNTQAVILAEAAFERAMGRGVIP